ATPTSGTYRPSSPLSAFNGASTNAAGAWTLTIADGFNLDTGVLQNWTLTVTTASVPPNSLDANHNGVPDECECATCGGDMTGDSVVDGADIAPFVTSFLGTYSRCADMDNTGALTGDDLTAFVDKLLTTDGPCP